MFAARALARARNVRLFLVGGLVRDLLLRRPIRDLDLSVEGDAASFARCLAEKLGGRVREHERFGTATIELPEGGRLDVAAARSETYARPGALPRTRPASIAEDLGRRDFTVNAMAIELGPRRRRLLDPFGGRRDLAARTIRFLHPGSPLDDPTRSFRAVRYARRLGFRIAPDSVRAIRRSIGLGAVDAISGDRLRREIDLLLAEADPAGAVLKLRSLGLLRAVCARWEADARTLAGLRRAEGLVRDGKVARGSLLFLLVAASHLRRKDLGALSDRLAISGAAGEAVRDWETTRRLLSRLRAERRPSRIRRLVAGLSAAEVGGLAASLDRRRARQLCDLAFRPVRLSIGGKDLIASGVPAGPSVGRALAATLAAREDGMIGAEDELDFALRRARGRDRRT